MLRPVITPMVRVTASISALTKFKVMASPCFWACNVVGVIVNIDEAATKKVVNCILKGAFKY